MKASIDNASVSAMAESTQEGVTCGEFMWQGRACLHILNKESLYVQRTEMWGYTAQTVTCHNQWNTSTHEVVRAEWKTL